MPNVFSHEMTNLYTIMAIFGLSYLIRLVANAIFFAKVTYPIDRGEWQFCQDREGRTYSCNAFAFVIYEQVAQYVWDFIPLLCILVFHRTNFRDKTKTSKKVQIKFIDAEEELQNRDVEVFVSQLIDETQSGDKQSSDNNEQLIRNELYRSFTTKHELSKVSVASEAEQDLP